MKAYGAQWVAPRAGEGRFRDPHWTPRDAKAHVRRYHDAGVKVFPWLFSRPLTWRAELDLLKTFIDEGADGVIIDAESAWDSGQKATALRYMEALSKELPDAFVADAPWAYPNYHPGFPFEEFATRVNARMPQMYWTEFDNWFPLDPEWWRFWLVLDTHIGFSTWKLGDGTKLGDKLVGLDKAGADAKTAIALLRRIVRKWKAAHTICVKVIVVLSGKLIGTGWKVGDGTKLGGKSVSIDL